ncbi:sugar transferase [Patescibacteria group bacterium]|nr:sugar transferase [Patescibacteria group bacterium]MBU4458556.1 sugar transferase [Patescibacteria group bacterium]MCG2696303.1 sugar transferase [Candidatus Portnoybacteria bacterium]
MKKSELIFSALLVPVDFLMLILAGIAAYFLRVSPLVAKWRPVLFSINLPFERYLFLTLAVAIFGVLIFAVSGLYHISTQKRLFKEFFQIIVATSATILVVILYVFFSRELFESRFIVLAAWVLAIIFVSFGRFFIKKLQRFLVGKYNVGVRNIVVIGEDKLSRKVIKEIKRNPDLGYRIIKRFFELKTDKIKEFLLNSNPQIDEVVLASPHYERNNILEFLDFCEEQRIGFKFVPNLFQTHAINVEMNTFDGVPLIEIKRTPLDGWGKIIKRWVDILGSLVGLIILSPLFLIIAIIIKIDSEGPIFVKLKRISQKQEFGLYKFRSMIAHDLNGSAESLKSSLIALNERKDSPLFKMKNDPRITRVGKFLRKTRIDELPQLINVLKGNMSLIGPRPHQPDEIEKYEKHHKKVLLIKPGMTGMAQISGSSDLPFEEEVKLDTYYIENWTLLKDIYILLKTIIIFFTDKSAC